MDITLPPWQRGNIIDCSPRVVAYKLYCINFTEEDRRFSSTDKELNWS